LTVNKTPLAAINSALLSSSTEKTALEASLKTYQLRQTTENPHFRPQSPLHVSSPPKTSRRTGSLHHSTKLVLSAAKITPGQNAGAGDLLSTPYPERMRPPRTAPLLATSTRAPPVTQAASPQGVRLRRHHSLIAPPVWMYSCNLGLWTLIQT
jgi:hypothetical protein